MISSRAVGWNSSPAACIAFGRAATLRATFLGTRNSSDVIRWSIDARYQSAALPTNARGLDGIPAVTPDGDLPTPCYPPEADFFVRSRLRPDDVCKDPESFRRFRRLHKPGPIFDRWNLHAASDALGASSH